MPVEQKHNFTSTGAKFFYHQEAMAKLRDGKGMPIVSHIMPTDICQHSCAFCSVATREGNSLTIPVISRYLEQLVPLGLKAIILSGGGNPILYRCKETKTDFNGLVALIKSFGLEIGLITNGMPMKVYPCGRESWKTVTPETLDKLTWVRISMSGLDHDEREVFVPDIDPAKTTLGFSYVAHDIYHEPLEPNHGKVSVPSERITQGAKVELWADRKDWLRDNLSIYVERHRPEYVRLLPNCLQPELIDRRCEELQEMANWIDPTRVFVQHKPPKAPHRCFLGYVHPVLNSDGYVYPCDSCVLNAAAGHKFAVPWRVCRWDEIADHYAKPVRSLVDPQKICPGCVFTHSNEILADVVDGAETPAPECTPVHPNFV